MDTPNRATSSLSIKRRLAVFVLHARLVALPSALAGMPTVLFSLAPALQATRVDLANHLAQSGRGVTAGRLALQRLLVGAQVALAAVLLIAAGLVVRSFDRLQRVSPGFSAANVLAFRISAQWSERPPAVAARQLRTLERLRAVPGVTAAALGTVLPAGATFTPEEFTIVGQAVAEARFAERRGVSAEYFRVLEVPVLEGESCRDDPGQLQSSKVLVNRTFVERFFGTVSPLGHHLASPSPVSRPAEIIGVVGDVRERGLASAAGPMVYFCGLMPYWPDPRYLVRVDDPHRVSMSMIREAVRDIEPARAVYAARRSGEFLAASIAQPRLNAILLSLFAWTTLLRRRWGVRRAVADRLVAPARDRSAGSRWAPRLRRFSHRSRRTPPSSPLRALPPGWQWRQRSRNCWRACSSASRPGIR